MKGSKNTQTVEAANNKGNYEQASPGEVTCSTPQMSRDQRLPRMFSPVSSFPQDPPRGILRLPARSPLHFYPWRRNDYGVRLPAVRVLHASTANAMFYVLPLPVLELCFRYREIYFRVLRGTKEWRDNLLVSAAGLGCWWAGDVGPTS